MRVIILLCGIILLASAANEDVAGPVVKLPSNENENTETVLDAQSSSTDDQGGKAILKAIDNALIKEFGNGTSDNKGEQFANLVNGTHKSEHLEVRTPNHRSTVSWSQSAATINAR